MHIQAPPPHRSQGTPTTSRVSQPRPGYSHHDQSIAITRGSQPQPGCPNHTQGVPTTPRTSIPTTPRTSQPQPEHPHNSQDIPVMARTSQPWSGHSNHSQGTPSKVRIRPPSRWELSAEQLWLQEQLLTSLQPAASHRHSQIWLWSRSRDGGTGTKGMCYLMQ